MLYSLADFYNKDYHARNDLKSLKLCKGYLDNCYKNNKIDLMESMKVKFICGYCLCCENDMKSSDIDQYLVTPTDKMKEITEILDNIKNNLVFNQNLMLFLSYSKFISYKNINPNSNICFVTDYIMNLFVKSNKLIDKVKIRIFLLIKEY